VCGWFVFDRNSSIDLLHILSSTADPVLCIECQKLLSSGGFYSKDGVHYCVDDYLRLYGTRCDICGEFVEGEVITALGNTYHSDCFHCSRCRYIL